MTIRISRALFCLSVFALSAQASLITSASQIGQPQTVITFSQFAGPNTVYTTGPVSIGNGVTFTSTNPAGSLLGQGPYSFNNNGSWNSAVDLAGLDVDQFGNDKYTMTFSFARPVSAVGGLMNYAIFQFSGFSDVVISALGVNGNVLESYDISQLAPISTPSGIDMGQFLGIERSQADIAAFSLSNSAVAITDFTFASSVPEPGTSCLLLAGLSALLLRRRGWRR